MKRSYLDGDYELNQGPLTIRPFEDIGRLLKERKKSLKKQRKNTLIGSISQDKEKKSTEKDSKRELTDQELFLKAMEGVRPLEHKVHVELEARRKQSQKLKAKKEDKEIEHGLRELKRLIDGEVPLPVEKIPEYIDGPMINLDKQLVKRLRRGDFAIQAYCELHGLRADEALQVLDGFLSDSLMNNYRAVAFIHGRGRSSPGKPVLKELVKNYLNRGRFRRYILAYSSAPSWDGGPGVTYCLLRKRPVKKRRR